MYEQMEPSGCHGDILYEKETRNILPTFRLRHKNATFETTMDNVI